MSQTDPVREDSARDTPTFRPARFDAPAYDAIESHQDLIDYSKAYFALVVAHYDMEIDVSHVREWEVTTRAKRRSAAVRHVNLDKIGAAFTAAGLSSPDWEALKDEHDDAIARASDPFESVKDVCIRLTWGAFESFDEEQWRETIRHEAIHVEQFHQYGTSDHGFTFVSRAEEVDAPENCPQFTDYKYPFECSECGEPAGGRYRESKAVKFARKSPEEQKAWKESGKTFWKSECCQAFVTMAE